MTSPVQTNLQQTPENNAELSDSQSENAVVRSPTRAPEVAPPQQQQQQQPTTDPNLPPSIPTTPNSPTKQTYRERVWQHLQHHRLAQFPLPARGRIPNVRGSDHAVQEHLSTLPAWQDAQTVCVNADKAQEVVRAQVLRDGKELYVVVARVEGGFLRRLVKGAVDAVKEGAEGGDGKEQQQTLKQSVNRRGLEQNGVIIPYNPSSDTDDTSTSPPNPPQLDLVVVGAVAVSRATGRHIGKGRGGYADLEYGILGALGTLRANTKIITVVHDCQVFDDLPEELFNEHDMSVDYIVTPTGVIDVAAEGSGRSERPKGIFWPLVSNRRLALMPVLQYLRDQQQRSEIDVTLKEEDTDIEAREPPRLRRRFLRRRRNVPAAQRNNPDATDNPAQDNSGAAPGDGKENVKPQRRRVPPRFFRRPRAPKDANNVTDSSTERGRDGAASSNSNQRQGQRNNQGNNRLRRPFRRLPPHIIDFSLKVSNIERSVRVRDLKQALVERGIKPQVITWVGYKGFCLLHYAKPRQPRNTPPVATTPTNDDADEACADDNKDTPADKELQVENGRKVDTVKPEGGPNGHVTMKQFVLDDVIEILQNMRIGPDSETNLDVTVMKPSPDKQQRQQEQQQAAVTATSPIPTRIETTDVSAV